MAESVALPCLQVHFDQGHYFLPLLRRQMGDGGDFWLCGPSRSLFRTQGYFITAQTKHMKKVSLFEEHLWSRKGAWDDIGLRGDASEGPIFLLGSEPKASGKSCIWKFHCASLKLEPQYRLCLWIYLSIFPTKITATRVPSAEYRAWHIVGTH